jgi:hypothetical protein
MRLKYLVVMVLQAPRRAFVHAAGHGEDAFRLNATAPDAVLRALPTTSRVRAFARGAATLEAVS